MLCCRGAAMAEHRQQEPREAEAGETAPKAPQEAVKVVLMPDGGYAVAVEVLTLRHEPVFRPR